MSIDGSESIAEAKKDVEVNAVSASPSPPSNVSALEIMMLRKKGG